MLLMVGNWCYDEEEANNQMGKTMMMDQLLMKQSRRDRDGT